LKAQASSTNTVISRLDDFKRCALEKVEELNKAKQNTYMNIQKIQDDYSIFHQSNLKAQDPLGEITDMNILLDDIRKWQTEFQKDGNKPSTISNRELHSYHIACSRRLERESTLEKVATERCDSCGKIEQAYQVALRKHQLLLISFEEYKLNPAHKHLYVVDELHEKLKAKIHIFQDPTEEAMNKYVVDIDYSAMQLSIFCFHYG